MFFLGVSLAFFVLHTFLYLFDRRGQGNLYLGVAALGYALFIAQESVSGNAGSELFGILGPVGLEFLGVVGIAVMIIAFIRFGHYFIRRRSPRVMAFFVVASIVAVSAHAATGSLWVQQIVVLLSLLELLRSLVRGVRQPPGPHAWVVGIGFLAILVTAGAETLTGFGLLPASLAGVYSYGMLLLFTSISVFLSWSFADTHRDLERKLVEVENLTERAVEQERRNQERETERRLLEKDNERQRSELEAARDLQLSMLPARAPRAGDLEVEFEMRTASEVGGDFYDFWEDESALTLAVGDATGHGVDAGLLVGTTKGLFHAAAGAPSLELALYRMAEGLSGLSLRRRNMALLLFRWAGGALEMISAGMPPVLVYRLSDGEVEEQLLGGPPLASIAAHSYASTSIGLASGDTVLACSDGLPERLDPRGETMGYRRLRESFLDAGSQPLAEIRARLFDDAETWSRGRPRGDDETVVLLRRR